MHEARLTGRWLAGIALASLAYRLTLPGGFLELDSSVYLRAVADYARHFAAGDWATTPLTREHYTAIEYWPPLFPLLGGLLTRAVGSGESAARMVSFVAGWLAIFPAFFLAARFWGPREGCLAAAAVGFYPLLAWHGRIARVESLYFLLNTAAVALALGCAWKPPPRAVLGAAAAGACFALAYMTRFDALMPLGLCLLAMLLLAFRQPAERGGVLRLVATVSLTFALAASPYLAFLASLNGGQPTLITPEKRMYDTLEGFSAITDGDRMGFIGRCGLPGMVAVDPSDPATREGFARALEQRLPRLLSHGVELLPNSLARAATNWIPALAGLALLGAITRRRDARVQVVAVMLLEVPVMAVLTSWDPQPRYYLFTIPLLAWIASPVTLALWDGRLRVPDGLRPLVGFGLAPALIFLAWRVPGPEHFDVPVRLDGQVLAAVADPPVVAAAMVCLACTVAGLAAGSFSRSFAVPLLAWIAAFGVLLAGLSQEGLADAEGLLSLHAPLSLAALAVALAVGLLTRQVQEARNQEPWERGLLVWMAAASLLMALQSSAAFAFVDRVYQRHEYSQAVAGWLRSHAEARVVAAPQPHDALRTGHEWIDAGRSPQAWLRRLVQGQADVLVVLTFLDRRGKPMDELTDPRVERIAVFPSDGAFGGEAWVLYRRAGRH